MVLEVKRTSLNIRQTSCNKQEKDASKYFKAGINKNTQKNEWCTSYAMTEAIMQVAIEA